MKLCVTLCRISISDPTGDFETRGYTEDGEPILRKKVREVQPHTLVELTEAEFDDLLPLAAVRLATASERATGTIVVEERPSGLQVAAR